MSQRWAMLLVIFFTRTSLGFQFQSIAALTPFLVTAFDISWAQVGLLMGLFMLPGVVFALPGGLLGQRFGSQRVVFAGLGLMIAGGMLVAYAGGFGSAAFGRTLAGIGGVLVNIMLARMVADWFRGRELQTSLGLMLAAWPFGMALALMMLGPLALIASWRVAEYATVVAAALALGGDGAHLPGPAGGGRRRRRCGCGSTCRGACGCWRSARASAGRCSTRASSWWRASRRAFSCRAGPPVSHAGLITGAALWISIVSVPLGGLVADRVNRPKLLIVTGCLAGRRQHDRHRLRAHARGCGWWWPASCWACRPAS